MISKKKTIKEIYNEFTKLFFAILFFLVRPYFITNDLINFLLIIISAGLAGEILLEISVYYLFNKKTYEKYEAFFLFSGLFLATSLIFYILYQFIGVGEIFYVTLTVSLITELTAFVVFLATKKKKKNKKPIKKKPIKNKS